MGININKIDQTNIILNDIYITYSFFSRFPLPYVRPVHLLRNLIRIPKLRGFLMRGQRQSLCQRHGSRTGSHLKTGWLPYQRKLSHKSIYITYYFLQRLPVPYVHPLPVVSNLIRIPKLRRFLIRGQLSSLCQCHISRTSCHAKTGWVPYQRKLSHNSTGLFLTINQPLSQKSY